MLTVVYLLPWIALRKSSVLHLFTLWWRLSAGNDKDSLRTKFRGHVARRIKMDNLRLICLVHYLVFTTTHISTQAAGATSNRVVCTCRNNNIHE